MIFLRWLTNWLRYRGQRWDGESSVTRDRGCGTLSKMYEFAEDTQEAKRVCKQENMDTLKENLNIIISLNFEVDRPRNHQPNCT